VGGLLAAAFSSRGLSSCQSAAAARVRSTLDLDFMHKEVNLLKLMLKPEIPIWGGLLSSEFLNELGLGINNFMLCCCISIKARRERDSQLPLSC